MKIFNAWLMALALFSTSAMAEEPPNVDPPVEAATGEVSPIDPSETSLSPVPTPPPAVPAEPAPPPPPAGIVSDTHDETGEGTSAESSPEKRLISVGARVDAAFAGGGQVAQGFSIPSLRLTAYGDVGTHLDYRLSLGQTREFSTVLLPQILPFEAYINLSSDVDSRKSHLHWRLGMFNPSLNPWWTPDLSSLTLPDYHETHKAVLLNNDIGTELCFQPILDRLEITIGAFNGNGIFSQNSNNTRAFTGFLRGGFPIGDSRIILGSGGYFLTQSSQGSVNYKLQWVANVFVGIDTPLISLALDGFLGNFEDAHREVAPSGGSGVLTFTFYPGWKLFSRVEGMANSPITGGTLTNLQLGPLWELDALKVFVYYQSLETGLNDREVSAQVRVRLAI